MPYGTPITGPKRGSGDTIPVSVFEAAVAAAFLGRPLTLFVSSQYLFNLKTLGQVRVVAPLLYCDGHSEPFRSLVETISLNFLQDLDGYSESFEPEMSIFARQAVWLRELLTEARAAKPKEARPPTVAILANRKNIIWKCFTYRHNLPDVQFYFNAAGASRWPTDVLNPSFYEHEDPPLPVGYQLSQSLGLPGATFSKRGLCGLGGPEASDSAVVLPSSPWSVSPPPNCWSRSEEAGVLSAD